jgi:hypothetical protein
MLAMYSVKRKCRAGQRQGGYVAAIAMDDDKLAELLAAEERAAAMGKEHIARQRALIQELRESGDDTADAEALLATFLQSQVMHEYLCVRLRMELALAMCDEIFSRRKN